MLLRHFSLAAAGLALAVEGFLVPPNMLDQFEKGKDRIRNKAHEAIKGAEDEFHDTRFFEDIEDKFKNLNLGVSKPMPWDSSRFSDARFPLYCPRCSSPGHEATKLNKLYFAVGISDDGKSLVVNNKVVFPEEDDKDMMVHMSSRTGDMRQETETTEPQRLVPIIESVSGGPLDKDRNEAHLITITPSKFGETDLQTPDHDTNPESFKIIVMSPGNEEEGLQILKIKFGHNLLEGHISDLVDESFDSESEDEDEQDMDRKHGVDTEDLEDEEEEDNEKNSKGEKQSPECPAGPRPFEIMCHLRHKLLSHFHAFMQNFHHNSPFHGHPCPKKLAKQEHMKLGKGKHQSLEEITHGGRPKWINTFPQYHHHSIFDNDSPTHSKLGHDAHSHKGLRILHNICSGIRYFLINVFIPILIGVAAGMTASLLGMVIGTMIGWAWVKFVRGGRRGNTGARNSCNDEYEQVSSVEIMEEEFGEKDGLLRDDDERESLDTTDDDDASPPAYVEKE